LAEIRVGCVLVDAARNYRSKSNISTSQANDNTCNRTKLTKIDEDLEFVMSDAETKQYETNDNEDQWLEIYWPN
jgi:hypothetical protein